MANTHGNNVAPELPFFDRIVNLEKEKQALADDIKEVYAEAKQEDIDVKALRLAVKRHLESDEKRMLREAAEEEADRILSALGEFVNTPLGEAAVKAGAEA